MQILSEYNWGLLQKAKFVSLTNNIIVKYKKKTQIFVIIFESVYSPVIIEQVHCIFIYQLFKCVSPHSSPCFHYE